MSCGGGVKVSNMTKTVKSGHMRRYKKGFFSSGWKTEFLVLHEDSMMASYSEPGKSTAEMSVTMKNVANFLCVGPYTRAIPKRPKLPKGASERHLIAIPNVPSRNADIHWFLCADDSEINAWMGAICQTLPPPPQQQQPQQPPGGAPYPPQGQPGGYPPPQGGYPPQGGGYPQNQGQMMHRQHVQHRGHYPQQVGAGGGNTTVIVQEGRRSSDGDNFAAGLLIGGAIGYGFGGWGYGWGGGWGYGGWGHYDYGPDVHIHNHYDIDHTSIEHNEFHDHHDYDGGYDGDYDHGYDGGGYDGGGFDDGFDGGGCGGDDGGGGCGGGCGGD